MQMIHRRKVDTQNMHRVSNKFIAQLGGSISFMIILIVISMISTMVSPLLCANRRFPKFLGTSVGLTSVDSFDVDLNNNIVMGGHSSDPTFLPSASLTNLIPYATYFPNSGSTYRWAKKFGGLNGMSVKQVSFKPDGSQIVVLFAGSPLTVVLLQGTTGTITGQLQISGQSGAAASALVTASNWIVVGYRDTSGNMQMVGKETSGSSLPFSWPYSAWTESTSYLANGGEGDDIYASSRGVIGGVDSLVVTQYKYISKSITFIGDAFATFRSWSFSSSQPHTIQKFNFQVDPSDTTKAYLSGHGSTIASPGSTILFYIFFMERGATTVGISVPIVGTITIKSGFWVPTSYNTYLYSESAAGLQFLGIDSYMISTTSMATLVTEMTTNEIFVLTVTFNVSPATVVTQKTQFSTPSPFNVATIYNGRLTPTLDFLIGGTIQTMPTCGVSFSAGYGTGFIAKSATLESCFSFTTNSLAQLAAVPVFDIGFVNRTVAAETPNTVSLGSGASVAAIASTGLYAQQTTCCFTIQVPTTYANQKYIISDPQLDYSFPLFSTLETCSDMTISFTYTSTYQLAGATVTPTVLWLDTTTTPSAPSFDALSSSESDVGVYQITLQGTINDGQYSTAVFDFYFVSSESVLAIPISDINYIDGSPNLIVYFSPFIASKPIYTVIYYLSNQDGTAYDSSVITFANGGGSTQITISTSDSAKIGTYLLQITGELVQNNAVTDVSMFTLNVVNKCYGTTIIPGANIPDQVFTIKFPASSSTFTMQAWKESVGTCNQFIYAASLYPYGLDLPPYFQFDPTSRSFTIIQQDFMVQGPTQLQVTGTLPWGQSYTMTFKLNIQCVVSQIIQPAKTDVVDIYYQIGVEDFTQKFPEFTWKPSVCSPNFHYSVHNFN